MSKLEYFLPSSKSHDKVTWESISCPISVHFPPLLETVVELRISNLQQENFSTWTLFSRLVTSEKGRLTSKIIAAKLVNMTNIPNPNPKTWQDRGVWLKQQWWLANSFNIGKSQCYRCCYLAHDKRVGFLHFNTELLDEMKEALGFL